MIEITRSWVSQTLPTFREDIHKYDRGVVLILAGSYRYRGAASLACMGALAAGAGLVCLAAPPEVEAAVAANLPEVTFLGADDASTMALFLDARSGRSTVIGPGLGSSDRVRQTLADLFRHELPPSVIDADALNMVASGVILPPSPRILTPHQGEMSRLLNGTQGSREADLRAALELFGGTIVLKGPETLIGEADRRMRNTTGNSGMASAGMGDVLSGIIGALLAQGVPPFEAAACGVFWHGWAGDMAAKEIGFGFTASQVAQLLPKVRRQLS